MKKIELVALLLLILTLMACSKEDQQSASVTPPPKVVQVETLRLEPRDLVEEFTLPGSLEAWQDLRLAAEIAGPVEAVEVEEGAAVKKGMELVRIDSLTLQANYDSALSDFELRKKTLARLKQLADEQLVSTQEYDNAASALDRAAATLRSAEIMLNKGRLLSPVDGLLEERLVDPGEFVGVGDPLVRIIQVDRLKINVDVPEKDIQFMRKGVRVTLDGARVMGTQTRFEGTITHVGYVAAPQTRTYRVRIEIDNSQGLLRPGMIVRARFVRRHLDQVLVVPLYAVVERDGQKYVFVRDGDRAEQRPVRIGATLQGKVVILEGLNPQDEVVIKGQQLLLDKTMIRAARKS